MIASLGNLHLFVWHLLIKLPCSFLTFSIFSTACVQKKEEQPKLLPQFCTKSFVEHTLTVHHVFRRLIHVNGVKVKALVATEESVAKIRTL